VAMDSMLTPVSTTYKNQERKVDALIKRVEEEKPVAKASFQANTPHEALDILKHEPDYEDLKETLRFLMYGDPTFNITSPSPITSQLIHVIVTEILPSYWSVLLAERGNTKSTQKKAKQLTGLELLLTCLRSVTGLNALLLALKRNIQLSKEPKKSSGVNLEEILTVLLQALEKLLEGPSIIAKFWGATWKSPDPKAPKNVIWTEFLGLIVGGKLLGNAAEAEDVINNLSNTVQKRHWVAGGNEYDTWLAKNVCHWAKNITSDSKIERKCCADLLSKSFRVGKTGM
jgi:telomere length regulation protein